MKKSAVLQLLIICIGFLSMISCEELDNLTDLGLRPNIYAPALKTEIDVYDFERLLNQNSQYIVEFSEIKGPLENALGTSINSGVTIPIFPGYDGTGTKLESQYLNIFEIAHKIYLEDAKATLSFTNTFPVAIQGDTRFILRDSANPENIFFNQLITTPVAPGEAFSVIIDRENDTISSTLEFFIQDINLASGTNVTFNGDDFVVNLDVEVVDIDKVELKSNVSYHDTATSNFTINLDNPADTAAYSGTFSIFLTNKYPAEFELKLDLLDSAGGVIYQIFGDSSLVVEHAPLDGFGNVIGQVDAEKIDFISVSQINNLDAVSKMRIDVTLRTPSSPDLVILNEITSLEMLITADIKIDGNKAE